MKNLLQDTFTYVLFFIFVILCYVNGLSNMELDVDPPNRPVMLGEKVVFTCKLEGLKGGKSYSVVFKRPDYIVSERCSVFQTERFDIICQPNSWEEADTFQFIIHKVQWKDRGEWTCLYAINSTKYNLDVYVPAELKRPTVRIAPKTYPSTSIRPVDPVIPRLMGKGGRSTPYDLSGGHNLEITCQSTCAYPTIALEWTRQNSSQTEVLHTLTNPINMNTNCTSPPDQKDKIDGMQYTTSKLLINCTTMGLIGLQEIRCAARGPQLKDTLVNKAVFVVCPGGELPMDLRTGEVVAIAVGCAIALILIFVGCVLLRRNHKSTKSGMRGVRV